MYSATLSRLAIACVLSGLLGSVAVAAPAAAEAERVRTLEQQLARSLQLIDQLAARVAALEDAARKPAPAASAATATAAASAASSPAAATAATLDEQARSIATLQESVNQIAAGLGRNANDTGVPVHGFIDVGAGWSSAGDPIRQRGFTAGSLDLYLTPQIGSRVKSLIELVVEFDEGNTGSIDMERVQIGYTFSDALTLWGGRFHTPFGLWNTSFHHGANLQTSISRPKLVDFEDRGGLIPVHSIGIWANGSVPLHTGKFSYDAYLANGPSIRGRELNLNSFTDDNGSKMIGGNLGYQGAGALTGLTVGVHAFATNVGTYDNSSALRSTTRLRSAGAYFGYDASDWEAIGEYYRFSNTDAGDAARRSSNAGFIQVGRSFGALTPFVRYERASLDPRDNYFRSLLSGRSYRHVAAGASYALDANSSLKFELRSSREAAVTQLDEAGVLVDVPGTTYRRALFQYSIAF